ncbi:MAG: PAS domain S-box protein [Nitrospirae bacterium]|nr:PAS domain S-box protein [Nitrospirota bacterium]
MIRAFARSELCGCPLFNLFMDMYFRVGMDGVVKEISNSAGRLTGYSGAGAMALDFSRHLFLSPGEWDKFVGKTKEQGAVEGYVTRLMKKDGTLFWASINAYVSNNYGGDIEGMVRDITVQKNMDEALARNEKRYLAIIEDQTDLICRFLPDGTLTFVNEAYCRYFGKHREELVGKSFTPIVYADDRQMCEKQIASLGIDNPVVEVEHRVVMGNGEVRWQRWTNRAIFDDSDKPLEFQAVGRDITKRKKAELALLQTEKLAAIGRLAAGVAHEINNPLTSASLSIQILKIKLNEIAVDPSLLEKLETTDKSIDAASTITKKLLTLTRMDREAFSIINLSELIEYALKECEEAFDRVTLEKRFDGTFYVMGQQGALNQAFSNVLKNSLQSVPDSGGMVAIHTSCIAGWVNVEISDTGAGISESDILRVFDPFFTTKELGEGLGLSVAYGIIRQHGGTIEVTSTPKQGSRVLITLPAVEDHCTKSW